MWPLLLDMTKEESMHTLRCLELEAYAGLVSALRAQGPLNTEKMKLLKDTGVVLNISQDRHKAEVRRAVNDEKLNTIAYHVSGQKITSDEWTQEGRRLIPLMPRVAPQTAYSAIADEIADTASKNNKLLPNPSNTERKRPAPLSTQSGVTEINKPISFRMPDPPKLDDAKKRKLSLPVEGSSLAQHLMGPPKMSKIQQIYRQKTKARQKEFQLKVKQDQEKIEGNGIQQKLSHQSQQKLPHTNQVGSPKVNIIQNLSVPASECEDTDVKTTEATDISACKISDGNNVSPQPGSSNENQAPKNKSVISCPKLNQHITLKHVTTSNSNGEKQIKVCGTRKNLTTKCITTGQKLIVVSNPQNITTSSILQRTLTIPFVKNISVKNFDKFKIVTTNANSNIQLTTLTTSGQATSGKHKVVTVRTNPTVKKVIPLSQLQVLNAKGGIKVLPLGGKIVTKTSTGSAPVYIVNSGNMQCITKSSTSSPIMMTCKAQDRLDSKSLLVLKNPDVNINIQDNISTPNGDEEIGIKEEIQDDSKSNVLADIMEAVGVVPPDTDNFEAVQSEQTLTSNTDTGEKVVPTKDVEIIKEEKTDLDNKEVIIENVPRDETCTTNNFFTYIGKEKSYEHLLPDIKDTYETVTDSNIGTLDPITGLYTLTTTDNTACEPLNVDVCKETVISESPEGNLKE